MNNHLTTQQMLTYIDGELSKSEMGLTEEHLHSCWTCLTEVERLKNGIVTILDAYNEHFAPALPPSPRPWPNFQVLLARRLLENPKYALGTTG
jgi:anti-sigma factor RsiW